MITKVSAVHFRQNLGEMLNLVQYRSESVVINKDGKPVAALVNAELFSRILRMRERFDALSQKLHRPMRTCLSMKAWPKSTQLFQPSAASADAGPACGARHQCPGVWAGLPRQHPRQDR
jgi:prevent-host-death family protein